MKIWKHLSNSIVNILGLVDDTVGEHGLRTTTKTTFAIVNESLEQSLQMNRVEAKQEMIDFLTERNASIDSNGVITYHDALPTKKSK
jgi:hypothetical protein